MADVTATHRLSQLTGCRLGNDQRLNRLTIVLEDEKTGKKLELVSAGNKVDKEDCKTIVVDDTDFISKLQVYYDSKSVTGVKVGTVKSQSFTLGSTAIRNGKFDFDERV